jgi:2,3-bisphosphoglycerate-independent phosphoglycerate mutase
MTKKVALIILDGWWNGDWWSWDAVSLANTPVMDNLLSIYPNTHLYTYGDHVGLPDGQMGNSEVWHLNIGAGRVVYQDFAKINKSIRDGDFFHNEVLLQAFSYAKNHHKKVHILWLLGDGGVHAHQDHIIALCQIAKVQWCEDVVIHGFLDGRDTAPQSALWFVQQLEERLQKDDVVWHLATLVWRYYAMDRDQRWDRIKLAYDLLIHGTW